MVSVPNLQVVVLAFSRRAWRLDEKNVAEIDADKVSGLRRDGPEAGDVAGVLPGIHGGVELQPLRVAVGEVLAPLLQLLGVDAPGRRRRGGTLHLGRESATTLVAFSRFFFSSSKLECDTIHASIKKVMLEFRCSTRILVRSKAPAVTTG